MKKRGIKFQSPAILKSCLNRESHQEKVREAVEHNVNAVQEKQMRPL